MMTTTSDPTTPDAVAMLQRMHARAVHSENRGDVPRIGSAEVLAVLRATQAERARHAEEVAMLEAEAEDHCDVTASLRDQLRRTEGARGVATRVAADHFGTICQLRDQLRKVEGERDVSRRQCGELHEHLALIVRYFEEETSEGDGIAEQHWAGYQLAKSVLVRTAPNEAAWETAMVEFAQLQERASKFAGAQHEIEHLRDQLRRVEGERDAERKHATEMEERALDLVRDLRLAQVELHALRSLLPDVRACAEYCRNILIGPPGMPVEDYPLAPVALAARRILAALDSQVGEGE